MEKLLFVFAVVFLTMALVSRHRLNHHIDTSSIDEVVVRQNFRETDNPRSLSYAIKQVSGANQAHGPMPGDGLTTSVKTMPVGAPQGVSIADESLSDRIVKYTALIQAAKPESVTTLEQALNETTGPEDRTLRLSLFQAALAIGNVEEGRMKDLTMREMQSTVVPPVGDATNLTPAELSHVEISRQIVSTAYKVYLNATRNPGDVLIDTQNVLNYQRDSVTRDLIIYDCIARYPDLRSRLAPGQQ